MGRLRRAASRVLASLGLRGHRDFASPGELDRFISEVRAELEAAGRSGAATRLAEIQRTAYTTGSEWLGDLGAAVRAIRREGGLSPALDAKLARIMAQARRR